MEPKNRYTGAWTILSEGEHTAVRQGQPLSCFVHIQSSTIVDRRDKSFSDGNQYRAVLQ